MNLIEYGLLAAPVLVAAANGFKNGAVPAGRPPPCEE